jgi:beta-glucosidase
VTEPLIQPVTFRLASSRLGDTIAAAVAAVRSANIAVLFADDNGVANTAIVNWLAPNQDKLIAAVANANPNTVVVLSTGDPVLMPWLSSVKAVLEMWYPVRRAASPLRDSCSAKPTRRGGFDKCQKLHSGSPEPGT